MAKIDVTDDATEFRVGTVNDLLEAHARGVHPGPSPGGDRYRQWAFASTGIAAVLAVVLAVSLLTGRADTGGPQAVELPEGMTPYPLTISRAQVSGDIGRGKMVTIFVRGGQPISGALVQNVTQEDHPFLGKALKFDLGVPDDDIARLQEADPSTLTVVEGTRTTPTTAPPAETQPPATEPAAPEPEPVPPLEPEPEPAPPPGG